MIVRVSPSKRRTLISVTPQMYVLLRELSDASIASALKRVKRRVSFTLSPWSNSMCEKFPARVTGWMLNLAEVQTTDALYTNESIHFNNRSPIWH